MSNPLHKGQCHCGAVKFKFTAPANATLTYCNCSMCHMTGFEHIFVPEADLKFVSGEDQLTEYQFGTKTARHLFCSICGIKPLYRPRSHPDSWSVNYRCVVPGTLEPGERIKFDGVHWEDAIDNLRKKV